MTCRQLIEFLADYLDRDLSPAQRKDFEQHLSICSECRRYLAQYKTSVELVKSLKSDDDPCQALPPHLVKAILSAQGK